MLILTRSFFYSKYFLADIFFFAKKGIFFKIEKNASNFLYFYHVLRLKTENFNLVKNGIFGKKA
jgi:hypothetical protein